VLPHELLVLLLGLGVLLLAATAMGRVARRLGIPAVAGELTAGILLGPTVLGHVPGGAFGWLFPQHGEPPRLLDMVNQLGVLLLVGITGAQLDVRLARSRTRALVSITAAALLIPFALGAGGAFFVSRSLAGGTSRPALAFFVGVVLSLSSIPVVAKILADLDMLHRPIGQLAMMAASLQDAAGWLLLSVASAVVGSRAVTHNVVTSVLSLLGFLVVAATIGRVLVRAALRLVQRSAEPGRAAAVVVALFLLGGALAEALRIDAVFGGFTAGILLGMADPDSDTSIAEVQTVTMSVFAPIFLASVGLRIDLGAVIRGPALATGVVMLVLASAGKLSGGYLGARVSGLGHWDGVALGGSLNARGVVGIVAATLGLRIGVLGTTMYTILVVVAVVTSIIAGPILVFAADRADRDGARSRVRPADAVLAASNGS
jgi:Kef-type K+ transport system membrane component KefB